MTPDDHEDDSAPPVVEPSSDYILQFFAYAHLPPDLMQVSRTFAQMADSLVASLPDNAERRVALRKLLESKDAAVRARIAKPVDKHPVKLPPPNLEYIRKGL